MKRKLPKIMGVVLTIVLMASFMAFVSPVSALTDAAWNSKGLPGTTGNKLVLNTWDLGPVAISNNFANDNTVFAAVNVAGAQNCYRSTNGGYSWSAATSASPAANIVALEVSPAYADDGTVVMATATTVYRSTNSGSSFTQLGVINNTGGLNQITSLAISPNYDGVGEIAIGCAATAAGIVAVAGEEVQKWGASGVLNWSLFGGLIACDVMAVAYSPNYPIDSAMLAVGSKAAAGVGTEMHMRVGGNAWDALSASLPVVVSANVDDLGVGGTGVIFADIALPSDYNAMEGTLRRAYISVTSALGVGAGDDDVFRMTNFNAAADIGSQQQLVNIKYDGTYAEGTIIGGTYDAVAGTSTQVYRCANPTAAASWAWYSASNAPSGTTTAIGPACYVDMASDFSSTSMVVAGTVGDDSAFAVSTDGAVSFNERGLIDDGVAPGATVVTGLTLSPDYVNDSTMFAISDNNNAVVNNSNVWVTNDGGSTWDRAFTGTLTTAGTGVIVVSPNFVTDSTVYVGDTGGTAIWYSSTGGMKWSARTVGNVTGIQSMAASDATTIYVGDSASGSITKSINAGWIWPSSKFKATGAGTRVASIAVDGEEVIIGGGAGTIRRSVDGGTTWAKVGNTAGTGNIFVDFLEDYVYAGDVGTTTVYRFQIDESSTWKTLTIIPAGMAGVAISGDNTLYVNDPTAAANNQVYRSINPTAKTPTFEWITGLTAATASGSLTIATGGSVYVACIYGTGIRVFPDVLSAGSAGPTLLSPADEFVLTSANTIALSVDNDSVSQVTSWDVAYSTDSTFTNNVTTVLQVPTATQTATQTLTTNSPVYWRARSTLASPVRGPWSETRVLYPQLTTGVNAPAQVQPVGTTAVNTPRQPVFNWGLLKFATGYKLQVAKDANFSDLVVDETMGAITSFSPATPLDYDTAYYWRVQGFTATTETDWSAGTGFRTMAKPAAAVAPTATAPVVTPTFTVPAVTPTITIPPTPAAPAVTPGWIYAIIAIGAVLVIAVLVLMWKTRRVV